MNRRDCARCLRRSYRLCSDRAIPASESTLAISVRSAHASPSYTADQYSDKLDSSVYEGLRLFNLNVRGKSVLLKPNIVEYIPGKPVNTDPQLIGAAAEAFLRLGAASVTVG